MKKRNPKTKRPKEEERPRKELEEEERRGEILSSQKEDLGVFA
jgi:hypothetical protein